MITARADVMQEPDQVSFFSGLNRRVISTDGHGIVLCEGVELKHKL
jgi:hypothetical protein